MFGNKSAVWLICRFTGLVVYNGHDNFLQVIGNPTILIVPPSAYSQLAYNRSYMLVRCRIGGQSLKFSIECKTLFTFFDKANLIIWMFLRKLFRTLRGKQAITGMYVGAAMYVPQR